MGIFGKLFNSKIGQKIKNEFGIGEDQQNIRTIKTVPSDIQDLLLISVSERYQVGQKEFPSSFRTEYGVNDPAHQLISLAENGFIRSATAKESLGHLKMDKLKEIANQYDLKPCKQKDELCKKIADVVPDDALENIADIRYWKITEKGRDALNKNSFISYYTSSHSYDLNNVDIDINRLYELVRNNPDKRIRDLVWGEYNRKSMECFEEATKTGNFRTYCKLLEDMAFFLSEEGRYKDALAAYIKYIYYAFNYDAGLSALQNYSRSKKINDSAEILFLYAGSHSIEGYRINGWSNSCDFDKKQLQAFIEETFDKYPGGLLSSKDLTDYVFARINENEEKEKSLCRKAIRDAAKELPKYMKSR